MNLTRNQRKTLDTLSSEVFGTSSRWQKLVNTGYTELLTEKKTETVPGVDGAPDTTTEVTVPILRQDGAQQFVTKRHSIESIETLMLDAKAKITEMQIKAMLAQAEKHAKDEADKLSQKVQGDVGGSAV